MKNVLGILLLLCFGVLPALGAGRPNVIVVLSDDQGYGDLSVHGNPILETPHLDRLHSESIRFSDFHTALRSKPCPTLSV